MANFIFTTTDELATFITNEGIKATKFSTTYFTDEQKSRTKNKVKTVNKLVKTEMRLAESYQNKIVNRIEKDYTPDSPKGLEYVSPFFFRGIKAQDLRLNAYSSGMIPTTKYYHNGSVKTIEELKGLDLLSPSFFTKKETVGKGQVTDEQDFFVTRLRLNRVIVFTYKKKTFVNVDALQTYLEQVDEVNENIKPYVEMM
tara:strand:- start:516 stop:1112 length:597 start_codon:yes stop_codon:yes gene_type:complete